MNYERQILQTLLEAGERGLSVRKIARHVFNMNNGLFEEVDYETIHIAVRQYLQRQSARTGAPVCRVSHGIYRFNRQTSEGRQLLLAFKDKEDTDNSHKPVQEDQSLSLF